MKTIVNLLVAVALSLAAAGATQADEPVLLRYRMSKDDKLLYRTTTELKQTQTINGNDMVTEMTNKNITQHVLEKVDEKGNFVVKTENKRLYAKFANDQAGDYVYDSTNDERDTSSAIGGSLTPLYDRLNGAMLSFTHSPRGKVLAVKGYKELLADLLKENPLAAQFAGGGSDEAAKVQQSDALIALPEKPVKPGDKWEQPFEYNLEKLGKFVGKKTYSYEGPGKVGDRETIKIAVTTELTAEIDLDSGGAKVTGTISISQSSGTAHFDPQKGQLVSLKVAVTMSGTLNVAAGGNNFTIPMEQKQTTLLELLDKLPEKDK